MHIKARMIRRRLSPRPPTSHRGEGEGRRCERQVKVISNSGFSKQGHKWGSLRGPKLEASPLNNHNEPNIKASRSKPPLLPDTA